MPQDFQRPFDPAITITDGRRYRLYFSCGPRPRPGMKGRINTCSAISFDGVSYVFEAGVRFGDSTGRAIDPTVTRFNDVWHYIAPRRSPEEGAFHATSIDGLAFTPHADIPSDNTHNWTGNMMLDGFGLRFYGSSPNNVWWSSSTNGMDWSSFTGTNVRGGDPATLRLTDGRYVMISVGPPRISRVDDDCRHGRRGRMMLR